MSDKLQNKFCSKPFEFFELGSVSKNGDMPTFACCRTWLPVNLGNFADKEFKEIWNSYNALMVRKSILDGSFKYCNHDKCPEIQSNSLPDKDSVTDPYFRKIIDEKIVSLERLPREINFADDRTCNLTCPSCRDEKITMTKGDEFEITLRQNKKLIDSLSEDVEIFNVCGSGDPFASKIYRSMLFDFDGEKFPNLKFYLTTNGLLLSPSVWEKMQKIHKNISLIQISVDAATSETYSIVREGGDFNHLLRNLDFLSERKKSGQMHGAEFCLDFVVQQENFREMVDFVKLGKKLGVDQVRFSKILRWVHMDDESFNRSAVYLENHPEYQEFLEVMKNPIFSDDIVRLGNCRPYHELAKSQSSS